MPASYRTVLRTLRLAIEYKSRLCDTLPTTYPWAVTRQGVVTLGWERAITTAEVARLRGVGVTEDDTIYTDLADLIETVQALV